MEIRSNIPPEIVSMLRAGARRVRRILFYRGLLATFAAFVATVLILMAVDAMVTIYSPAVRWCLWSVGVAATGVVAYFTLVRPQCRRIGIAEIAALIERNHPELEERILSVVGLAQAGELDMSSSLVAEITRAAERDAGVVSPRREFTGRTVKPRLIAAVSALAVLGALFALFPRATFRLATRAIVPSAEVDNIYASSLTVTPGDQVVLVGSPFVVNLSVDGGFPARAFVRSRIDGREETVERMSRLSDDGAEGPALYTFKYPAVRRSFSYRVNCGNALTRAYRVEAVPEPTCGERTVTITHPAYTGRSADVVTNTADIVGLPGSHVRVTARPSREGIEGVARFADGLEVAGVKTSDGRLAFDLDLTPERAGAWGLVVWDRYGFSNQVETATVSVVADTPPEVKVVSPEASEIRLPADGSLPVDFAVKEDFGVSRAVLEMCVGSEGWKEVETVATERTGELTFAGSTLVRLLAKTRGEETRLRFRVRVEDNLPKELGGPGVGCSGEFTVVAVKHMNDSLERQSLASEIDSVQKDLNAIGDQLRKTKDELGFAENRLKRENLSEWERNVAQQSSEKAKAHAENAEKLMAALVEKLEDGRLGAGAEEFKEFLKERIAPLRQGTEDVLFTPEQAKKAEMSAQLKKDAEKTMNDLWGVRKEFEQIANKAKDLQRLSDLATREANLAENAAEEAISVKDLVNKQLWLKSDLDRELSDELRRDLTDEIARAEELSKKGEELKARQEELKRLAEARQIEAAAQKKTDAQSEEQANGEHAAKPEEQANGEHATKPEEQANGEHAVKPEDKALAEAQEKLAKEIAELMHQAEGLKDAVNREAGPKALDENRTVEPAQQAARHEAEAAKEAQAAADQMKQGDVEKAKESMDDVASALAKANEELAAAKERMRAKNEAFAAEAERMKEAKKALQEAIDAARAAEAEANKAQAEAETKARESAQQAQNQQGQNQQGQNQQAQSQQAQQSQQSAQQAAAQKAQQNALGKAQAAAEKLRELARQQAAAQGMAQDESSEEGEATDDEAQDGEESQDGDDQESELDEGESEEGEADPNAKPGKSKKGRRGKSAAEKRRRAQRVSRLAFGDREDAQGWFKMKSESSADAESDLEDVPKEYRGLVRDYFKALNEGGKK